MIPVRSAVKLRSMLLKKRALGWARAGDFSSQGQTWKSREGVSALAA
jgi:hypothetical protein